MNKKFLSFYCRLAPLHGGNPHHYLTECCPSYWNINGNYCPQSFPWEVSQKPASTLIRPLRLPSYYATVSRWGHELSHVLTLTSNLKFPSQPSDRGIEPCCYPPGWSKLFRITADNVIWLVCRRYHWRLEASPSNRKRAEVFRGSLVWISRYCLLPTNSITNPKPSECTTRYSFRTRYCRESKSSTQPHPCALDRVPWRCQSKIWAFAWSQQYQTQASSLGLINQNLEIISETVVSAIPDRSLACNSRVSAQEGAYPPSRLRAFALPRINWIKKNTVLYCYLLRNTCDSNRDSICESHRRSCS